MSDTTFTDNSTVIVASWLNDINDTVYGALNAAQTPTAARTALGLGTASQLDVGTTANKVVQLTAASKLPAVDGSLLTGIVASSVDVTGATGTLAVANGGTGANDAPTARTNLGVLSSAENQTQAVTRFITGGTADAITGTLSPAIASYTAGLRVTTTPGGANTVTGPTLNLNSLGTKTIKKRDSGGSKVALVAGDYNASGPFDFEYDGTDFVLLNPQVRAMTATVGGLVPTPPNNTTTFLRGDGTFSAPSAQGITLGTPVNTTSGTAIDFTGIPTGTKRIVVMLDGMSLSGSSIPQVQIGDSGGVETSGYLAYGPTAAFTSGFPINNTTNAAAATTYYGTATLTLMNAATNTWACSVTMGINAGGAAPFYSGGTKTLSPGPLDRIRITTVNGTDTFDAGSINISYE